jgi:eukaryotic-like serine/threonine-protein kinase
MRAKLDTSRGSPLGNYEAVSRLCAEGMDELYRTQDTRLDLTVGIKVVSSNLSDDVIRLQRFKRGALAVVSLPHPHICGVYDISRKSTIDYLVLE